MSIPKPDQVQLLVDDINEELAVALDAYKWAYNFAFSVIRDPDLEDLPVKVSAPADTTAAAVVSARMAREGLEGAAKDLHETLAKARAARGRVARLTQVGEKAGRGRGFRTVSKAELELARKAKERRLRRGEGWGDESLSGVPTRDA